MPNLTYADNHWPDDNQPGAGRRQGHIWSKGLLRNKCASCISSSGHLGLGFNRQIESNLNLSAVLREKRINGSPYIVKPFSSLAFGARHNNAEHTAVKIGDPTKTEDAILPNCLQGVAKNLLFSFYFSIGRVEHYGCSGFQQSVRYTCSGIVFPKLICDTRPNHPVHPSFQYRRRLSPPVRMDYDYSIYGGDFPAMFCNCHWQLRVCGDFFAEEQRIEALSI